MSAETVNIDDARRKREQGRVSPHNTQAEQSLLGAMLIRSDPISVAIEAGLKPDDFHSPAHAHIFEAIVELFSKGQPADPVTVDAVLQRRGHGDAGGSTLIELQAGTTSLGNAGRYARIIADHSQQRRVIRAGETIRELGYEPTDDVAEVVDQAEQLVYDLRPL